MKERGKYLLLLALLPSVIFVTSPFAQSTDIDEFEQNINCLTILRNSKKISEVRFSEVALALIKEHYPDDFAFQTLAAHRLFQAKRLAKEEIFQVEFDYFVTQRTNEYLAMKQEEVEEKVRQKEIAEWQNRQAEAQRKFHTFPSIGKSFRNAYSK